LLWERDLDVVELWSGVGSIYKAAVRKNLRAKPFDIGREPGVTDRTEDITSPTGVAKL
jgi:hypothetical protein